METKNITVTKDVLTEAYKNGNKNVKDTLTHIFGTEMFRPKNIMDRVKTFEDAVKELGENHLLVKRFRQYKLYDPAILDHLKLRIITAALNEGWEPQFIEDEYLYFPRFDFYTRKEINEMSKDELANVFVFDKPIGAGAGLAYAYSISVPSLAYAGVGSRLCFKTKKLAEYAAKQFIELYADYYLW